MNQYFSHPHPLQTSEVNADGRIQCFCCEQALSGPSYSCTVPNCYFFLHDSCFQIPHQILHNSHPGHPLTLVSTPQYPGGQFWCDACGVSGTGFSFHCFPCQFDLHVKCSRLPETVQREDHPHPLTLFYSLQPKPGSTFLCDICWHPVLKSMYSCPWPGCDFGTHLGCVNATACPRPAAPQPAPQPAGNLAIQVRMMQLQQAQEAARARNRLMRTAGVNKLNLTRNDDSHYYYR